jgi:hypothetical protein
MIGLGFAVSCSHMPSKRQRTDSSTFVQYDPESGKFDVSDAKVTTVDCTNAPDQAADGIDVKKCGIRKHQALDGISYSKL